MMATAAPPYASSPSVQIRISADSVTSVSLASARVRLLKAALPWREFRWYKGQRHFSGSYWSATMGGFVGYESRLEYANLLTLDFDHRVRHIVSQPFLLEGDDGGTARRHIPDFLVIYDDDSVGVVDVKPTSKLSRPKVRDSLAWTRREIEVRGWEYRVLSEPDPVVLANLQFLAGYRRPFQFLESEVNVASDVLRAPCIFSEAVELLAPVINDRAHVRALVLHLLWLGRFKTDLSRPLSAASEIEPA